MLPGLVGEALLKGAGLLLVAGLVARLLRRASAAHRHLVWAAGMGAALLVPLAGLVPRRFGGVLPFAGQLVEGAGAEVAGRPFPWALLAVVVWGTGVAVLILRVARDLLAARGLVRRSVPAGKRWTALVAVDASVRESAEVVGPVSAGLWRGTILVPAGEDWAELDRRAVLAHEQAHVRRHDCLTQTLARVACALHWVNPLVWWAERELRREREMAADDAALAVGTPSAYARFLMSLAADLPSRLPRAQAAMMSMASSALAQRLEWLLGRQSRRPLTRRAAGLAGALMVAVALAAGCLGEGSRGALWVAMVDERAADRQVLLEDDHPVAVDLGTRLELVGAQATLGRDGAGRAVVNVVFPPETAARLSALTGAHLGERMALVQGERVLMAPTLRSQISDRAKIDFSDKEDADRAARDLLAALQAP